MSSFSFTHWVVVALIVYVIYRIVSSGKANGPVLYCTTCGNEGKTDTVTKGSIWIEIVLWMAFLVPGLIYSIWRLSTRHKACASCGATTLVPTGSPVAVAQKKALSGGDANG